MFEPFGWAWSWYWGLDPEQQRSVLLLLAVAVCGGFVWAMYQAHGDRVVVVLPTEIVRYSLLLLALPVVLIGLVTGRGTSVPGFLRTSWTAAPDPERARIPVKTVNPIKLPRRL